MPLRLWLAVLAGKLTAFLSRLLGRQGSTLPGRVALRVYPGVLKDLGARARRGTIMVTGTNGKTTTNHMLAAMLTAAGYSVVTNREGANMRPGVVTAYVRQARLRPGYAFDYAVLEVDEGSFPGVVAGVRPDLVVVTNFFRDQLDRYGDLEKTVAFIRDTLKRLAGTGTRLVLNADDPLAAQLGRGGLPAVYFGLAPHGRILDMAGASPESRYCPLCGTTLAYTFHHYGQLGLYKCPGCGFARPRPVFEGTGAISGVDGTACRVRPGGKEHRLSLPVQGFYNLYNALAALAAGVDLGLDAGSALDSLRNYRPADGRLQHFRHRGRPLYLNLVKNPAGFNENLAILLTAPGSKDVYIALNDHAADGRDVSWLWDVNFEALADADPEIQRFVCTGRRGAEVAVRLKYAGIPAPAITIQPDVDRAVSALITGAADAGYLLSSYTALRPTARALRSRADGK